VDLVSELGTKTPSSAKRTADELQCGWRTVCVALWCHSHQTSHGKNILYYTANILVWVGQTGETWTSFWASVRLNGWVYVAGAQGVALLFNEFQYQQ